VFTHKTSLTFLESNQNQKTSENKQYARVYSGSPGYLKGNPLLMGNTVDNFRLEEDGSTSVLQSIQYNLNGFPLRGSDNEGRCYFVENAVSNDRKLSEQNPQF